MTDDGATAAFDGLPPLRDVIRAHELDAKKSLGQNFILDFNLLRRIARLSGPLDATTVIEVGPGPGGLTRALLAEGARRVIAIERDDRCRPALAEIAERYPGRLEVLMADALAVDWARLAAPLPDRPAIIANLPYNIASRLLVNWLEPEPWPPWFSRMALMFQREVADRITARPETKPYGRLSVLSQWRADVRIALTLPPDAFTPKPKIASSVVTVVPRESRVAGAVGVDVGRLTQAAFGQRRKMLRQSLKGQIEDALGLLAEAGIDPQARGETITPEGFARLAALLAARRARSAARQGA